MKNKNRSHIAGILVVALLCAGGCASGKRFEQELNEDYTQGRTREAEQKLSYPASKNKEKERLLVLLNLGSLSHAAGDYEKSSRIMNSALDLARELYTVSITDKLQSGLFNAAGDTYAGMEYEISQAYYYQVLNFLMLAYQDKVPAWHMPKVKMGDRTWFEESDTPERALSDRDRQQFLSMARAQVLAWDTYLQGLRNRYANEHYYKDDLAGRLISAHVHRKVGSRDDLQISTILYQSAQKILENEYMIYPTFQMNSTPTDQAKNLEELIAARLKKPKKVSSHLAVILDAGLIPEKKSKTYTIGLSTLFREIEDPKLRSAVEQIGMHVILEMAPKIGVGLVAAAVVGAVTASKDEQPQQITEAIDKVIGFEFRLPSMESVGPNPAYKLLLTREEDKSEIQVPVSIVNPLAEVAYQDVEVRASNLAFKTGVRVGLKYLAALVSAIVVYKTVPSSEGIKILAASASWVAGRKAIDASEPADTRYWNFLPRVVAMTETELEPGKYKIKLVADRPEGTKEYQFSDVELKPGESILKKYQVFD